MQGTLWWFVKRLWGSAPEAHQTYFPGAVFLLLAVGCGAAFWMRRDWHTSVRGKVGFAFFGMSLGLLFLASDFWGHSPWNPIYRFLPGASGIRDIGRIGIVANAGLLISGALFLDFVLRRWRQSAARLLLVSCMALALAENCLLLALSRPRAGSNSIRTNAFTSMTSFTASTRIHGIITRRRWRRWPA